MDTRLYPTRMHDHLYRAAPERKLIVTHFTHVEGGKWIAMEKPLFRIEESWFQEQLLAPKTDGVVQMPYDETWWVHALRVEHGHEWDCYNGWRCSPVHESELEDNCIYADLGLESYTKVIDRYAGYLEYKSWGPSVS